MIEGEEQEILLNTLAEQPQEEIHTIEEDIYVIGVESLNGQAGDLTLKNINGEDLVGEGNIALQTPLDETQMAAVNSGIDSTKVAQIATNADNITTLQNTKQDNLTQTQLNAVNSGIDQTKVAQIATNAGNITSNTNRITTIEGKVPSTASSSNKLTDKDYVDNAIATNTANYISDNGQPFQSYADLVAYSGPLTNNDYAFVETIDSAGNDIYTRYKYNADQNLWAEEYTITNPYFTSDQWASINSGIAANDVTQIGTNKSDIASLQSGKQDKLTTAQQAAVDSGIDATKVQQIATNAGNITSLQTDKQDKLIAGTNIQIAADGKTISATDTTYTAGTGLTLTGTQFSVTEPVPTGFFADTAATQEGTGTTITLNNTVDAPIDNVELKGDTFQQTYSGKNLLDISTAQWGYINNTGGISGATNPQNWSSQFIKVNPNTTYTFSFDNVSPDTITIRESIGYYDAAQGFISRDAQTSGSSTSRTFTTPENCGYVRLSSYRNPEWTEETMASYKPQFELGSATAYEPYVGGIPSPNPSYPQDIQVVTGEQTVVVSDGGSNSQFYTIDLGATELCKIGTYQDYIWNDGADWKIHKETAKKTFDGTETWSLAGSTNFVYWQSSTIHRSGGSLGFVKSPSFTETLQSSAASALVDYGVFAHDTAQRLCFRYKGISTTSAWETWLSTNNTTAYYVLDTPTDTAITDATLIAQLEALANARSYSPQTNITANTPSPNLPTILTIDAFQNNYAGLLARLEKAGM